MKKTIVFTAIACALVLLLAFLFKPDVKEATEIHHVDLFATETDEEGSEDGQSDADDSSPQDDDEITGWSLDDFSHIQIGVSTKEDLVQISPRFTNFQRGRGEVLQFRLDDGRTIEFVCQDDIVTEISFRG